jgi:hypothetical protein
MGAVLIHVCAQIGRTWKTELPTHRRVEYKYGRALCTAANLAT